MGVYAKGKEMPKTCCACFCARDNKCGITRYEPTFAEWYEDGVKDCPLVPVPPHGRLIDADALMKRYGTMSFSTVIVDAPTIIEAEGEE